MKKIFFFTIVLFCTFSNLAHAQWDGSNPLVYKIPKITTFPPITIGQPLDVVLTYHWFDQAMRSYTSYSIDSFLNAMQLSDTAKYIANALYRICDDDPITYHLWLMGGGGLPLAYWPQSDPSHTELEFLKRIYVIISDTARSAYLLSSDIISDVKVIDTFSVTKSVAHGFRARQIVRVSCSILDQIKGNYVPSCAIDTFYRSKGIITPQSLYPSITSPVRADTGGCLQFEYSLGWDRMPNNDYGVVWPLVDSMGTWIKPDSEYIVFLGLIQLNADSSYSYFTLQPLWGSFGSNAGMYPVRDGIVIDPHDDFGIGASSGLTVSQWKTRLRARISKLINP